MICRAATLAVLGLLACVPAAAQLPTLWQLFYNGRKPVLRPLRYSVKQMRKMPSQRNRRGSVQEQILREVEHFLRSVASPDWADNLDE